jgi:hypothetical protein
MPEPVSPVAAGDDWPAQAADTIVRVVGQVRDRTTGPAITASRAVVFGLLAALLGTVALTVLSIVLVRGAVIGAEALLDLGDLDRPGRAVWIAHLFVGVVFLLGGLVLWKKAVARPA